MSKQCPFKSSAVQAQAARLVDAPRESGSVRCQELALESARDQFGTCDQGECAMWDSWKYTDADGAIKQGGRCELKNYNPDN